MKVIKINEDARLGLKKGADFVADIVKSTLGPAGRNIVIGSKFTAPKITNDGKLAADAVELEDETENLGVQMIRDTTNTAHKKMKGGRSTAMVLSQAIINEGYKKLDQDSFTVSKVNPMAILREIEAAKEEVIAELEKGVVKCETLEDLQKVAFVAAENKEHGDLIASLVHQLGKDGVIKVEEGDTLSITHTISEGMEVNNGYVSPMMVTNDKMESVVENAHILVTNNKVISEDEIKHLAVELNQKEINDLVIFASDFDQAFTTKAVFRRLQGGFRMLLVKVNLWDKGILEDICTVTGATLIDTNKGMAVKDSKGEHLAVVSKIIATADKTTLIGTTTDEAVCSTEITKLKNQLETATIYDKQKLLERIARLSGKVATISVGAITEIERGRIKDKIEDAVSETKLALEGGVVKGAGLALKEVNVNNILSEAIKAPYKAIQENAGGLEIGEDIVDAFLVTKTALEIACSNAANFLTVATSSAEKNEIDTKEN